jgi:hypothetical protein
MPPFPSGGLPVLSDRDDVADSVWRVSLFEYRISNKEYRMMNLPPRRRTDRLSFDIRYSPVRYSAVHEPISIGSMTW